MKTITLSLIACLSSLILSAQQIPDVNLRDVDGNPVSSLEVSQPGEATLLVFWKSTSGKCCENLENLYEAWTGSLKLRGIKMVAICVDCNGSWSHVKPIVNGNGWDFETYIDVNGDFRRALGVGDVPCSMLFDGNQNLVCRYNSGCTGSSDFICENILNHLALLTSSAE